MNTGKGDRDGKESRNPRRGRRGGGQGAAGAGIERGCYIAGRWSEAGEPFEIRSPCGGIRVGRARRPSSGEVDEALRAAREAAPALRRMPAHARAALLRVVAERIRSRAQEFARLIALESGKPIRYARAETERAAETFAEAAEECSRLYGEVIPLDTTPAGEGRIGLTAFVPAGPVLAITPFNFPLNLAAHKLAPALAVGCPALLKPASATPLTALLLAETISEAGAPAGALSVLPMSGEQAQLIAARDEIATVSFTGSAPVGWRLRRAACRQRVTLELGGNAAVIVHRDWDDLPGAAARIVLGGYAFSGQVCIAVQRIYVHAERYADFVAEFVRGVRALRRGDPLEEATEIGPMIGEDEARRVEEWVGEACAAGASALVGGAREGAYYPPTVLERAAPGMKVVDEEVFGPVTVVFPYDEFDAALAAVNDSRFGLQAGVYARDVRLVRRAFETLEVGGVIAGDVPTFRVDRMPYGGVKESGRGREGVRWAMRGMCEQRLLVL